MIAKNKMFYSVWIQNWEESERGWGTRPDGFTVHVSKAQLEAYVHWYNKTFNNLSEAPDEYTRASGSPIEIEVSKALYDKIAVACQKDINGRIANGVHGQGSYFSTQPMRSLKDSDIHWWSS